MDGRSVGWQYTNWEDSIGLELDQPSLMNILIEGSTNEETGNVDVYIRLINPSDRDITGRLHVVITEDSIQWSALNGQEIHNKVPRTWWPDASGKKLVLEPGEDLEQPVSLPIDETWNPEHLKVIAYLQDENITDETTMEIYQGAAVKVSQLITSIPLETEPVYSFELFQNFPNPFNPDTRIPFHLDRPGIVSLEIYNSLGQLVQTLINSSYVSGNHVITWNGTDKTGHQVAGGIYFYQLRFQNQSFTRKMLLVR